MRNSFLCTLLLLLTAPVLCAQPNAAQTAAPAAVTLPAPARSGGMTLNEALQNRRSVRAYAPTPLSIAEISQLLWAAQGITGEQGHRTAPSAHAQYYLHVYVAQPGGFFEYLPATHALQKLSDKDLRGTLSTQDTVKAAPVVFLIAGEYERAVKNAEQRGIRLVDLEAGHAAQNMLLQATALGLGAVPVGGVDPKQTAQAASLPATITPIYLIPVGHPK